MHAKSRGRGFSIVERKKGEMGEKKGERAREKWRGRTMESSRKGE